MKYIESIIAVDAKAILFTRVPARDCRNSTRFSVILIHSLWTDVATFSILTLLKSFKKKKKNTMMQTQLHGVIYLIMILMFHAFCLLNKHRNNISNVGIFFWNII